MNQRFSITPSTAAVDLSLTDSVFRTLAVIGIYGDKNGWCWPSQSTLAEIRGVSRQTINTHTKDLIASGYLNIYPRYDEETGAQKSNMMQIKFDYEPDLTGGVKSKALQGGTSPEVYTPPQAIDFTHNDLFNAPKEQITSPLIAAYENAFGVITYRMQETLLDDDQTYGTAKVIEAINIAKERGAHSYAYVAKVLEGRSNEPKKVNVTDSAELFQKLAAAASRRKLDGLTEQEKAIFFKVGGVTRFVEAKIGYEYDQLKKEVANAQ
jgi:hypothetical protein